jgi:hypothetical protein
VTSARPTFGEFIASAYRQLSAAATYQRGSATPGRDLDDLAAAVAHLAEVLSRYTADLTRVTGQLPEKQLARLGLWDRASLQSHDALTSAIEALTQVPRPTVTEGHVVAEPARHLRAAAQSLAAGRDLLQGHFGTEATGARRYESSWSLAITSPTVSRALLTEVAALALQTSAAIHDATLSPASETRLRDVRCRLGSARYWMAELDASVYAAGLTEPLRADGREVLYAVPANVMPARHAPERPGQVADLLDAVVTTAERARHAAWSAARVSPTSTAVSVTSWHRIAAASTVTSHHCHVLYTTLADRVAGREGKGLREEFLVAAERASRARELWLDSAREFEDLATEIRGHVSPAAIEAADLASWTGKLAYADPGWTLSSGPSQPVRAAESLAPKLAGLPDVVSALHQTTEALSCLASANLEQARLAIETRRLMVATHSLPERYDVPLRFTRAPEPYATSLMVCCQDTANAAAQAAGQSADLAIRVGAPSRMLAQVKTAALEQPENRRSDAVLNDSWGGAHEASAGPLEGRLRSLGVTNSRALWRATAVDRAAAQVLRDASEARSGSGRAGRVRASVREQPSATSGLQIGRLPDAGGESHQAEAEP